jgi:very-short-patch-repair endonuclease
MKLLQDENGRLYQAGIADSQPISLQKQATMRSLSERRKAITTQAEKKMCFALQVLVWRTGGVARYQREKTVHIADILSRSLDFYFSQGKVGIEVDGKSHNCVEQKAKDEWTDRLMMQHSGILVLRFSNENVMANIHAVIGPLAEQLRQRHHWPAAIRARFDAVIQAASSPESWQSLATAMLDARRQR